MADNEKWQDKPGEGEFSARRDGSFNRFNNNDRPRRPFGENKSQAGNSFDRPRRSFGENSERSGNAYGNDRGNSFDKPRRSFGNDGGSSFDRPRRSFGENTERSGNSYGNDRGNSFDRPRRSFGSDSSSDRPRRSFGNDSSSDRPRRSFGGDSSSDRPQRSYGDRPQRSFGEGDSGNRFDRPSRSFNDEGNSFSKPRRSFGEASEGNSFDRPRRSFGDDRSQRSYGDRPQRSFGGDRPQRPYGEGDRPQRSYGDNDRQPRSFGDNDRPRRSFDGESRPRFNGPMLPKPDRNDGRPRRPRIQKEAHSFDHGKPFGRPSGAPHYPVSLDPDTPLRLNKFLANAGLCSRREADEFIQAGVVSVNGEVVTELGVKVKPTDTILFHDQLVNIEHKVYILLNKPKDCVTTSDDPQERRTVLDLVKGACAERIYPVGRLDRNTTGVLLLTNDGDLASKLTHPKFEKRKIYQVTLDKDINPEDIQHILDGVTLEDCEVRADNCSFVDDEYRNVVGIEIHTGQNRVIRRIFESLGYKVFKLDRVYFAGLTKKNLPRGKWRHLSEKEVSLLKMGAFV